jgi:hypothetical protein
MNISLCWLTSNEKTWKAADLELQDLDQEEGDEGEEEGPPPPLPDRDYLGETQHTMEQVKAMKSIP